MSAVRVRPGHPEEARALLEASHALMQRLFPADSNHYLSIEALAGPEIRFVIAEEDGRAVGCGAVRLHEGYGEVKSLFTDEAARGCGIGDAVLTALAGVARDAGLDLLRLETGNTLAAAQRLYERHGFSRRGPFGSYSEDPLSVFYEKAL